MFHLAVTSGEPAGIGPEVSLGAAKEFLETHDDVTLHLVGDASFFSQIRHTRCIVEHVALSAPNRPGQLNTANASYVLQTLNHAIEGCLSGQYQGMITAPVQKSVINEAGITFSGHTEYLAQKCHIPRVVMMLCGKPIFESDMLPKQLRVALLTTHIPLAQVPKEITSERIEQIITILDAELKKRFAITKPTIAVTGLNPHAGESGHMGREEIDVIEPTLNQLKQKGYDVIGPLSGDTVFNPKTFQHADVVLAMYHDQGLAPFKFATFGEGVNVTLGLPIIRTSVDHGTALDIAGKGLANKASMLAALQVAYDMARNSFGSSGA